nr:unnamed protein product [Digitaria exilis]
MTQKPRDKGGEKVEQQKKKINGSQHSCSPFSGLPPSSAAVADLWATTGLSTSADEPDDVSSCARRACASQSVDPTTQSMSPAQHTCAASRPIHSPTKPTPSPNAMSTATGIPTRFTRAARVGLALPRSTPHPTVCGQLPSSQSPTMGSAAHVSRRISASDVNILPHAWRTPAANAMAPSPIPAAPATATCAAARAREGRLAPSSFPTRVETPSPSEEGNT